MRLITLALVVFYHLHLYGQSTPSKDTYTLSNDKLRIEVNLNNSSIKSVVQKANPALNPLSWKVTKQQMPVNNRAGEPFMGHFLCTNRWGSPSSSEMAVGIPHNGEVNTVRWEVVKSSSSAVSSQNVSLNEHLKVTRQIKLEANAEKFTVTESFENTSALDRVWNVVQHPTIGPPFLNKETKIYTNAAWGFDQRTSSDSLTHRAYYWPHAHMKEGYINLANSETASGYVSTHVFDPADSVAFIAARNPDGSLFGYCWLTKDYPWLNLWHYAENGNPVAKGLEFGTTGKGIDYLELLTKGVPFHGHLSWDYLKARETKRKSYTAFFVNAPTLKGVTKVILTGSDLRLSDAEGVSYTIK